MEKNLRSIIMVGTRDSENGMCLVRSTSRVALKEYAGGLVSAPAGSVQLFCALAG